MAYYTHTYLFTKKKQAPMKTESKKVGNHDLHVVEHVQARITLKEVLVCGPGYIFVDGF